HHNVAVGPAVGIRLSARQHARFDLSVDIRDPGNVLHRNFARHRAARGRFRRPPTVDSRPIDLLFRGPGAERYPLPQTTWISAPPEPRSPDNQADGSAVGCYHSANGIKSTGVVFSDGEPSAWR